MSEHITKQTELNKYSQENNLDGEKLWYRFGQLTKDQEQIRTSTREFVKECANEIRTETDSRNSKLVEKILDKHNRLIEVLLTKSSFLKTLIDELSIELSNDNKLTKKQINQISKQLASTITKILKNKTTKETKTTIKQVDPVSLLTNETIVNQFSKNFRSRFSQKYKQTLSKDKQIANRFNIKKNITRISNIVKSFSESHSKIQEQFKKQQFTQKQINNISVFRKSGKITKAIKTNQVEKLRLYNDYVINRTAKTIDRIERSFANALRFKFKNKLSRKLGDFKQSIIDGAKSLFSTKAIKTGFGFVGKVLSTVLLKPIMFVGKVLISSLKGLFKLGLGMVKTAFGLTGKIFKYLNENLLKKIAKFIFTPPGMFITGYLWAFFKDKIGGIFDGVSEKVKSGIEGITKTVRKIKTSIAKGLLKVVNGISTNKVLIAFLTRDSATIAEFMNNIKLKFGEKFDVIRDFFKDTVSNISANLMASALSWIGAAIGTMIGGPIGSIIGSLAGSALAIGLGKLFANEIASLPETDSKLIERLKPIYKKYGTVNTGDNFKESGLYEKIQQRLNKLEAKKERMIQKAKDNGEKEPVTSSIDSDIQKIINLKISMEDINNENKNEDFYKRVNKLIDLTAKSMEYPYIYSLPNSGDELKKLIESNDIESSAKAQKHNVNGKQLFRPPNNRIYSGAYELIYKNYKLTTLDKLSYMAQKQNLSPDKFYKLYDKFLKEGLNKDYSEKLHKMIPHNLFYKYDYKIKNKTFGDFLTKPLFSDKGEDSVFITTEGGLALNKLQKGTANNIKVEFTENYKEISEQTYQTLQYYINNLVTGEGPNCLESIKNGIAISQQEKDVLNELPVETWYRRYLAYEFFNYFDYDEGNFIFRKDKDRTQFVSGFKSFIMQFLEIPEIQEIIQENKKQGFMEKFNKLRERLTGIINENDVELKTEMKKLEEKETKFKKEMEDNPEYKRLNNDLQILESQLSALETEIEIKEKELVTEAKNMKQVFLAFKPTEKKEPSISEEENGKGYDFGYGVKMDTSTGLMDYGGLFK